MNLTNERQLAARAKTLGESAAAALPELATLARSDSALVRRLAASAVGKLAGIVDSAASVDLLMPSVRAISSALLPRAADSLLLGRRPACMGSKTIKP